MMFFVQAVASVGSEYLYAGRISRFHCFDRCLATLMALWTILQFVTYACSNTALKLHERLWPLVCTLLAFYFLNESRKSKTYKEFTFWHSCWHYIGSFTISLFVYVSATKEGGYLNMAEEIK